MRVPESIELNWGEIALRGYRWDGDGDTVMLLHDVGADLDAWVDIPSIIAADGYRVVSLDLPGHGLSDDPWDPERAIDLVTFLVESLKPIAARCFVVAAGQLCGPTLATPTVDAVIALSPEAPGHVPDGPTPPTLVIVGGADRAASSNAHTFFRGTRGWAVVSSLGTTAQSTGLFASEWGSHAVEQTLLFLRDYRS